MQQVNRPGKVNVALFDHPREDWLALTEEEVVDPQRPIIDAHHHLWQLPGARYVLDEFLADLDSGHAVDTTVYVECKSGYRREGPANRRSLGEIDFVLDIVDANARNRRGRPGPCKGIVGGTDFCIHGEETEAILHSMMELARGRLRGIRQPASWTPDASISPALADRPQQLLLDESFRRGFSWLGRLGLSFDAFIFHPQIPDLIDLAHAFPDTKIVLDHLGGPVKILKTGTLDDEAFKEWRTLIRAVAQCPNVWIKLGGLGMKFPGFDVHLGERPPGSDELAKAWGPFVEVAIEAFGVRRAMFESNFPPDKGSCSYRVLWNTFKKITASYSEDEKNALFSGTAAAFYRL